MKKGQSIQEIFRTMTVPQAVKTMAMPAVISQLIVLVYNLADTYFVGQTNNPYMVAGVSLLLPVFNLTLALGGLFVGMLASGLAEAVEVVPVFFDRLSVTADMRYAAAAMAIGKTAGVILFGLMNN